MKAGVIGLGDMGSGLALNLIKAGFQTWGFDIDVKRMRAFAEFGGSPASAIAQLGRNADAIFVMVMTGTQAKDVIFGHGGLVQSMEKGGLILITATIKPSELTEIAEGLQDTGLALIDTPVSGGFPGAQSGTLTMMAAAPSDVLKRAEAVMKAVSSTIHHVGDIPGQGQTVKACLQTVIGSIFAANFEASVLAAKAGISGQVIYDVFTTSGAGCGVTKAALENIIDRKFEGTGSHISTMHKDLTISLDLAQNMTVPLHMAAQAMQIFHAGKSKYPNGDNWVCTRVIEDIVGVELHRNGARAAK